MSVAGPGARMTEARIAEMAPLVIQAATELASFWPLRTRSSKLPSANTMIAA